MKPVVLETARLRLDSPVASDHARVFEFCQDPVFRRYLTLPFPYREKDATFFLENLVPGGWETGSEFTWAIRQRTTTLSEPVSEEAPGEARHERMSPEQPGAHDGEQSPPTAVAPGAPGDLLGVIGYRTGPSDIGYWLGTPHRGFGYMPEAVTAVTAWLFGTGVTRITWECVVGNSPSAIVARRTGFRYSGERPSTGTHEGVHVPSWHGVLYRDDTGEVHGGWPDQQQPDA